MTRSNYSQTLPVVAIKVLTFIFRGNGLKAQKHWVENGTLRDITFLELFSVVVSIFIWGSNLRNKN